MKTAPKNRDVDGGLVPALEQKTKSLLYPKAAFRLLFCKIILEHWFCASHFITGPRGTGQQDLKAKVIWRLVIWATELRVFQFIFFSGPD